MRQEPRRNVQVVLQQVALGKPQPGKKHFLQIGELHRAAINGQRNGIHVSPVFAAADVARVALLFAAAIRGIPPAFFREAAFVFVLDFT